MVAKQLSFKVDWVMLFPAFPQSISSLLPLYTVLMEMLCYGKLHLNRHIIILIEHNVRYGYNLIKYECNHM